MSNLPTSERQTKAVLKIAFYAWRVYFALLKQRRESVLSF
jgi:hypothetical protein